MPIIWGIINKVSRRQGNLIKINLGIAMNFTRADHPDLVASSVAGEGFHEIVRSEEVHVARFVHELVLGRWTNMPLLLS